MWRACSTPAPASNKFCMFTKVLHLSEVHRRSELSHLSEVRSRKSTTYFFFFLFHLTYSRWTSSLPSCLWSQRIFPSLPGSRLTTFYRDTSSELLQLVNKWLNFTYSRSHAFRYEKKTQKSYFGKNRTHDFRTSRCTAYLLDHSGDTSHNIIPGKVVEIIAIFFTGNGR